MRKLLIFLIILFPLSGCLKEKVPDTDGDGWDDAQEVRAGTDPTKVDTDDDGLWDPLDPNPLDPAIPGREEARQSEDAPQPEAAPPETPLATPPHTAPAAIEKSYLELVQGASPTQVADVNLGEQISELAAAQGYVAVAGKKGFRLFDIYGRQTAFYPTQAEPKQVVLSPDGSMVYGATEAWERTVYAISQSSELMWKHIARDVIENLALSGNGEVIAYSSYRNIHLLHANNGTLFREISTDVDISSFVLSKNASYVAVAGKDGTVSLYTGDGKLLWEWDGHTFKVDILDLAVSGDGRYVVAGTNYFKALLFDSTSPHTPKEIKTGAEVIQVFAAPDDSYLAAVSYDGNIYYFNTEGELLLKRSYGRVYSQIAFSPAGGYAAADNSIRHIYFFK
ncbi:WD40 repeat domain-containing protein [Candidatus Pyrohabitans sp.]